MVVLVKKVMDMLEADIIVELVVVVAVVISIFAVGEVWLCCVGWFE